MAPQNPIVLRRRNLLVGFSPPEVSVISKACYFTCFFLYSNFALRTEISTGFHHLNFCMWNHFSLEFLTHNRDTFLQSISIAHS